LIIKIRFLLSKNIGLVLIAVYPFRSIDYTSYRSAGFCGQLGKGFHTINGLTRVCARNAAGNCPRLGASFFKQLYVNKCPLPAFKSA